MTSNATEQCSLAHAQAMLVVRPRTDGRNGLTKKVVQNEIDSHLSNARTDRDDLHSFGAYETERSAPAIRTLHAFCARCQVDPSWLVALCGWEAPLHETFTVPPAGRVMCTVCIDMYARPCERCGS